MWPVFHMQVMEPVQFVAESLLQGMGEDAFHMQVEEPAQLVSGSLNAFEKGQGMQCASHMQEVELA